MEMDIVTIDGAIHGERGETQRLIADEGVRWICLLLKKNADYGCSIWDEPMLCPGMSSSSAILVRMGDKINRLKSLMATHAEVSDESIDDTLRDLGAYCLLLLANPNRNK